VVAIDREDESLHERCYGLPHGPAGPRRPGHAVRPILGATGYADRHVLPVGVAPTDRGDP